MEPQRLRTDVQPRVFAYMQINAPTMNNASELTRYWILEGIKRDLSQRREETGQNLRLNEELVQALATYAEEGEIDEEVGSEPS
jgi:hypothetical protein